MIMHHENKSLIGLSRILDKGTFNMDAGRKEVLHWDAVFGRGR